MSRERIFSLEETATALKVSPKTILRRIKAHELQAFRSGGEVWVLQKSLREWIFRALAIVRNQTVCKTPRKKYAESEQIRGQIHGVSRYSIRETVASAPIRGKVLEPSVAALKFQDSFRYFARRLAPQNYALQDDLVQEMSMAVLECKASSNRRFFLDRARSRALDYLDYEQRRGMKSISDVKHPYAPEPIKNEALRLQY